MPTKSQQVKTHLSALDERAMMSLTYGRRAYVVKFGNFLDFLRSHRRWICKRARLVRHCGIFRHVPNVLFVAELRPIAIIMNGVMCNFVKPRIKTALRRVETFKVAEDGEKNIRRYAFGRFKIKMECFIASADD